MLWHPAPWLGLAFSAVWLQGVSDQKWASAHYEGLLTCLTPLLLGLSLAVVSAFARERVPISDDAPMDSYRRSLARLLGAVPLVGLVAVLVVGAGVWLRLRGGIGMGDEPGHTDHAYYSVAELLQPVLLACFAVALGAAVVHLVRSRTVAWIVLPLTWFLFGATYWMFQFPVIQTLTPFQVQPSVFEVAPGDADPTSLPASWLLSAPGEYQDYWGRVVVSPALAGWHDVYLVALTLLLLAVAVPGRWRRPLLLAGAGLAFVGVAMQLVVAP